MTIQIALVLSVISIVFAGGYIVGAVMTNRKHSKLLAEILQVAEKDQELRLADSWREHKPKKPKPTSFSVPPSTIEFIH